MRIWLALGVLVIAACGSSSVRVNNTHRYYGYSMAAETSFDREPPPTPPGKATAAIQKLKRVAFVPPDTCLDLRAADTSTTVDKRVLRMQCGVTMSELEREAERAGFDVVTWQSLKGSNKPLEQAKDQKIDLLFEVNELDVVEESDRASASEFRYVYGDGPAPPQPLQVTGQDNEACKAYHAQSAPKLSGLTSVLDIKMVLVNSGSVLWSYRHTENMRAEEASNLVRFPVQARQEYKTSKPWWPWLVVGLGIGLLAAVPDTPQAGGAIAVIGLGIAIFHPKRTRAVGNPQYEPVQAVLCRRQHIVDQPKPVVAAAPTTSDRFRSESKVSGKDWVEERKRGLIKRSVNIFMTQLTSER